ncbi:MAG TPA: cupin domain-containing protein [Tahibacter sp.]|nr:cupin domain-containing protein [Tahibacter sp.]
MKLVHLLPLLLATGAAHADAPPAVVTTLMTHALADRPGKEVTLLSVAYPPGGASAAHRHEADAFVYVLEGAIVMGVAGGKAVTLGPGETFREGRDDIHTISRNASDTKPAKFVVFLIKDIGKPVQLPVD